MMEPQTPKALSIDHLQTRSPERDPQEPAGWRGPRTASGAESARPGEGTPPASPPPTAPQTQPAYLPLIEMLDEENSDWLSAHEPEPTPQAAAATPAAAGAAPGAAEAPVEKSPLELLRARMALEPPPPKKHFNKHWARPRFLQYDYLYHYMHNYYDDCIEYLDKRMRGYESEAPRPQTWAERALRTYTRNTYPHSITYNVPVPRQKDYTHMTDPRGYSPPHRLSYFRSPTSSLVSTDTGLITRTRLYETKPPKPDSALLYTPHWANTWHSEHSKDYYNRKYKAILF